MGKKEEVTVKASEAVGEKFWPDLRQVIGEGALVGALLNGLVFLISSLTKEEKGDE